MNPVITIDGVENPLKNEVCKIIARKLNCYWVSTEVIYRGISYIAIQKGLGVDDVQGILNTIFYDNWEIKIRKDQTHFEYNRRDVTDQLFLPEVTNMMNQLRSVEKIQKHMRNPMRDCAELDKGLVAGGSDCGLAVFPNAVRKFYLHDKSTPIPVSPDIVLIDVSSEDVDSIAQKILTQVG